MMRSHELPLAENEAEPCFLYDSPGGACIVACTSCYPNWLNEIEMHEQTGDQCNVCKKYFVYRPWWSW